MKLLDNISNVYGEMDNVSQMMSEIIKVLHHYADEDIKRYGKEKLKEYPAYRLLEDIDAYNENFFESEPDVFDMDEQEELTNE